MNYPMRKRYFDAASLFLHPGLIALSSYITVLITEAKHGREVNDRGIFIGWSALIACVFAQPICSGLRHLEEAKHAEYRLRASIVAIMSTFVSVQTEVFFTLILSRLMRCTAAEDTQNCQAVSLELTVMATLISNFISLLALWPLAKWSAITAEEIAEGRQARNLAAQEQGDLADRGAENLIQISQLPNADVIANCPITHATPTDPVRFECSTGDFLDPTGNRVSTAIAWERIAAEQILEAQRPRCPMTRRPVTGLVAAPDVLDRAEPTALVELSQPLLPNGDALPDDGASYGTFGR